MSVRYPSREYALLQSLGRVLGSSAHPLPPYDLTLGDDAAVRRGVSEERIVLTTDIAVEDVHFSLKYMSMEEIGYRVIAANVSDCAAMAAMPEAALVQLVFPRGEKRLTTRTAALYRGIAAACRKWRVRIVGGDLAAGTVWTIGITMLGAVPAAGRAVQRTGARRGDSLWVAAFPGRSAAGLVALETWGRRRVPKRFARLVDAHVRPKPCPELGLALGRIMSVHAMMDLSDGISKDARTLCFENRLGLDLFFDHITPPADMLLLAETLGRPWQEWALHGGEEYTLLFAASQRFQAHEVPCDCRSSLIRLGVFTDRHRDIICHHDGTRTPVARKSFDHVR